MKKSEPSSGIFIPFLYFFRNKEKNEDGSEKEITYGEYVDKINKRALKEQKKIMQRKIKRKLKDEPDDPDSNPEDDF